MRDIKFSSKYISGDIYQGEPGGARGSQGSQGEVLTQIWSNMRISSSVETRTLTLPDNITLPGRGEERRTEENNLSSQQSRQEN